MFLTLLTYTFPLPLPAQVLERRSLEDLDSELQGIMGTLKLDYLIEREGGWTAESGRWEDRLSLGEQQRIGMGRVYFHKPSMVFLDECTNATSADIESSLYDECQRYGMTIITTSQRAALVQFHSRELRLMENGSWKLFQIISST